MTLFVILDFENLIFGEKMPDSKFRTLEIYAVILIAIRHLCNDRPLQKQNIFIGEKLQ